MSSSPPEKNQAKPAVSRARSGAVKPREPLTLLVLPDIMIAVTDLLGRMKTCRLNRFRTPPEALLFWNAKRIDQNKQCVYFLS